MEKPIARASITIDAPAPRVWEALVTPELVQEYMFGATVVSDWKEGALIVWRGDWKGKPFEDRGTIVRVEPQRLLRYTHYSPLSGKPDEPASYHTITVELTPQGGRTLVSLAQDNVASDEEREHSEQNWRSALEGLKKVAER